MVFTLFVIQPGRVDVLRGGGDRRPTHLRSGAFPPPVRGWCGCATSISAVSLAWCAPSGRWLCRSFVAAYTQIGVLAECRRLHQGRHLRHRRLPVLHRRASCSFFPKLGARAETGTAGKAIRVHANGGPEVLTYEDFDPGQARPPTRCESAMAPSASIFSTAYYRSGLYPAPNGLAADPGR